MGRYISINEEINGFETTLKNIIITPRTKKYPVFSLTDSITGSDFTKIVLHINPEIKWNTITSAHDMKR